MPEVKDLPYLVRLLEDDSPVVRDAVKNALAGFGDGLYDDLRSADIVLERGQKDVIEALRTNMAPDGEFLADWQAWTSELGREDGLEQGFGLLARLIRGDRSAVDVLSRELDGLAAGYRDELEKRKHVPAVHSLSEFLFTSLGFTGDDTDYYLPRNSDLLSVIDRRRGNPISLACLYRFVGNRVDLEIEACNFPGHFMASVVVDGQDFLVDCFNRGRFVSAEDLRGRLANVSEFIDVKPAAGAIVRRALMNLVNAHEQLGEEDRASDIRSLAARIST